MKGIPMKTWEVSAILAGRKTVTRRAVKGYALEHLELDTDGSIIGVYYQDEGHVFPVLDFAPYSSGDILYVRETFWPGVAGVYEYKADYDDNPGYVWHPSIHMPREAARIFLRVTDVRVERLQEITPEQAMKEGVIYLPEHRPYIQYEQVGQLERYARNKVFPEIWSSAIKPADRALYGWEANPWVWRIEFERCEKPKGV